MMRSRKHDNRVDVSTQVMFIYLVSAYIFIVGWSKGASDRCFVAWCSLSPTAMMKVLLVETYLGHLTLFFFFPFI